MNTPKPLPKIFNKNFFFFLYFILGFILGIELFILYENNFFNEYFETFFQKKHSSNLNLTKCKKYTLLENQLYCIRDSINIKYKKRIDVPIPDTILLKNGGDCYDWSRFWEKIGKKLNYKSKIIFLRLNRTLAHAFTVINNDHEYCIVDIKNIHCYQLKNE